MSATLRSRPLGRRLPAPDPGLQGRELGPGAVPDARLIDSLKRAVPDGLEEIQTLARTLTSRSQDVLAHYRPPSYLQRPHRGGGRTPGAPTRHRPGLPQPHPLHHPQPHPHRTPQRPPESNHLNQTTSPTHHTLKHEEPLYIKLPLLCPIGSDRYIDAVSGNYNLILDDVTLHDVVTSEV